MQTRVGEWNMGQPAEKDSRPFKNAESMKHIQQLDSIRAIAVILVIISHWIPKLNVLPWGEIGVDIFFVLSGFLITGILLDNKKLHDALKVSQSRIIGNFIVRRTLRIFPIYYLMVFVHYVVADFTGTSVKENILFYLTYTSNILFYRTGHLDGIASHFWSLAVEEQFYLIWPWVILFIKRQYLFKTIWIFVCVGVVFPFLIPGDSDMLTPACFTAFALGALLAYTNGSDKPELETSHAILISSLTLISLVLLAFYPLLKSSLFVNLPIRLPISIITLWLIRYCLYQNNITQLNWVLNSKPLMFIGKISYGIYIYHTIIPWLWGLTLDSLNEVGFDVHQLYVFIPESLYNELDMLLKFFFLICISWLSWIVIEGPINSLKRKFEYNVSGGQKL
jgi:peptidoglycan/LPS O-acetylase OafA/YrhL